VSGDALIGHSGFVGGALLRQRPFDALFNSHNIDAIFGRTFDTVICAGVPAVKWAANKDPNADWAAIGGLIDHLKTIEARSFVLISTIDVYRQPIGVTEHDAPSPAGLHPYGLHRLRLEAFVAERFARHAIVRLPALFGTGLKKNAVYDLIHLNQTEKIIPNAAFQWYPTRRLGADLDLIARADVSLINITAEPVAMSTIRDRFFAATPIGPPVADPPLYDARSVHDRLLGGHGGYHLTAGQTLAEMSDYLAEMKGTH